MASLCFALGNGGAVGWSGQCIFLLFYSSKPVAEKRKLLYTQIDHLYTVKSQLELEPTHMLEFIGIISTKATD